MSIKNNNFTNHGLMAALLVVAGCAVGPDFEQEYAAPPIELPQQFIEQPTPPISQTITAADDTAQWWQQIGDPLIEIYVKQLLNDNLQLKQATARLNQSLQQKNAVVGGFFPAISASASGGQTATPVNGNRNYSSSAQAGLNLSWQLDLFGKIRRSAEAANARLIASEADKQALTQTLIADLATRRINLYYLGQQLQIAEQISAAREKQFTLTNKRHIAGLAGFSAATVNQARQNLAAALAAQHEAKRKLVSEAYILDILLGKTPGSTEGVTSSIGNMPELAQVPLNIPAQLLDNRPDLRAARAILHAQVADIGVAIADMYPDLSISGNLGFQSNNVDNLFSEQQIGGSLLGSITAKIFAGGALKANVELQKQQVEEQAAIYAAAILTALREVETALNDEKQIAKRVANLQELATNAQRTYQLNEARYNQGIVNLNQLLNTQQASIAAQRDLLTVQQLQWNTRIRLYLALGGNWQQHDNI